jgi:hypothetical protein
MFAHLAPGKSLADELIADRRAEARAEDPRGRRAPHQRGQDQEGEIIRCLKRYIAREVHASLREDLGSLSLSP